MKSTIFSILLFLASASSALATVNVTSPANNSTVSSPVTYVATATASTCAQGVAAMGVYVDNVRVVVQNGASLNASVAMSSGQHYTVVQEWDGCGGSSATAINVTVGSSTGTTTVSLSASPTSITAGNSSVLSVTAANATGVTVTGSNGTSYTLPASGGNQTVSPTATATYTATATGTNGNVTSTATVTVTPASTTGVQVSSPANNSTVTSPVNYVATATSTCAKGVSSMGVYVDNVRVVVQNGASLNASVAMSTGKHYTVVQEWDACGGSTTAAINVTVGSSTGTTVSLSASPTSITPGNSSVLSVTAANATGVTITGSNGTSYTLPTSGGNQTVSPTATTTYTATAAGASGNVTSTATVTVTQSKPTVAIAANPASINSGASSVLNVTATNATQVTISGSNGTSYTLAATGGSQTVTPTESTTYTATATGSGGSTSASTTVTVAATGNPTVDISANPPSIAAGSSSTLTVTATNATQVTIAGSDGSSYTLSQSGGTQSVSPSQTTTYTAQAVAFGGASTTSATTVTVAGAGGVESINHVIFMLQENHSFDNYFGMLNPYRAAHGWTMGDDGLSYSVDGIDDKLSKITNDSDEGTAYPPFKFASTCIDDESSALLESYGDVNRWDFSGSRLLSMDGFVHTAEGFAKNCVQAGSGCAGSYTDLTGKRAMGYYDDQFLNYYYYMASQFAVSDRWFSPISSKSVPNRIATFTGGTTQGLTGDPGADDHLPQLNIATIFSELDQAKVSWKIYYTTTQGGCLAGSACAGSSYPDSIFDYFTYAHQYLYVPASGASCAAPTQPSSVVGDTSNSFCIDPSHIVPLPTYYNDLKNRTLSSFSFIESGSGYNDEHPGSGQSILSGQTEVASIVNGLMSSPSWGDSAFFLSYDEGGGPYDHVPPVPDHSNQNTDATVGSTAVQNIPDISTIAVNADSYEPCLPPNGVPTLHCDLPSTSDPGGHSTDALAEEGFRAQLGFRVPNMVISPFTRKHYVSHIPMDHTAVMKFVENRFIGSSAHLTARDAAQPNLLDFFDFSGVPWMTPPTPPAPVTPMSLGYNSCTPQSF